MKSKTRKFFVTEAKKFIFSKIVLQQKSANFWNFQGKLKHFLTLLLQGPGNTKGGGITVPLTSCLTGLD
jgi:hypothetical protein